MHPVCNKCASLHLPQTVKPVVNIAMETDSLLYRNVVTFRRGGGDAAVRDYVGLMVACESPPRALAARWAAAARGAANTRGADQPAGGAALCPPAPPPTGAAGAAAPPLYTEGSLVFGREVEVNLRLVRLHL